jgi:hypothetical protein
VAHDRLARLRKRLHKLKCQKHKHFDDFGPIIKQILKYYSSMFPDYRENRDGSRVVHSFNIEGAAPISLEREHGSRDHIPPKFAKRAICGIEEILNLVEAYLPEPEENDDTETQSDSENENDPEPGSGESGASA